MTKAKTKDPQPALFAEGETPPKPTVTIREGTLKKNLNDPPKNARPPTPKSQTAPKKSEVVKFEPKAPPPNMLAVIAAAAANPDIDATKMESLYRLYQETEGKQQFHDALIGIELPSINRDGKIPVSGGKSLRFASFENVHKAVIPLLREHGFRMSFQPMPATSGEGMVVECKLIRGTYEEKCIVPISTASVSRAMNSQQAVGAAISYAKRYGLMSLLNLRSEAPEDRDVDGNDPSKMKEIEEQDQTISAAELKKAEAAIEDCGVPLETVNTRFDIKSLKQLRKADLPNLLEACAKFKTEKLKRAQQDAN